MRVRGFEKVKEFENDDFNLPKRTTKNSAGYDFESPIDVEIKAKEIKQVRTGVKAYMMNDEVLEIYNRSSYGKKGLKLPHSVGIIDSDYYNNSDNEGEISFLFENTTNADFKINKGDRIGQGIFKKFLTVDNEEKIDEIRSGGFGSTEKKGITLIALAVTIIVLIILISVTSYLTIYNIEQSRKNLLLNEVQTIQNVVLEIINTAKMEGNEISEDYTVYPLESSEKEYFKNYLSSDNDSFFFITAIELEKMNIKNVEENQQFIINWETAEVLNLNRSEYKGTRIKAGPVL